MLLTVLLTVILTVLVVPFVGCETVRDQASPPLPGPYLDLQRLELGEDPTLVLVDDDGIWRIEGTPHLVDERTIATVERSFRRGWSAVETRPAEHTAEALELTDDGLPVRVIPTVAQPIRYVQGREELPGQLWILVDGASNASLVADAPALDADPLFWRADEVIGGDSREIVELRMDPGPRAIGTDAAWVGVDEELDSFRVERLVRLLVSMDAEPIAPRPFTPPRQRFVLVSEEDERELGVHSDDGEWLLSIDGHVAFRLQEAEAEALLAIRHALGPRERLAIVPERVTHVRVIEAGAHVTATPDEDAERGWASELPLSSQWDRWVRAAVRLDAEHDADYLRAAFVLPRRRAILSLGDEELVLAFTWHDDEAVYARVGRGVPFRVERSSDRILRTELIADPPPPEVVEE